MWCFHFTTSNFRSMKCNHNMQLIQNKIKITDFWWYSGKIIFSNRVGSNFWGQTDYDAFWTPKQNARPTAADDDRVRKWRGTPMGSKLRKPFSTSFPVSGGRRAASVSEVFLRNNLHPSAHIWPLLTFLSCHTQQCLPVHVYLRVIVAYFILNERKKWA